MQWLIRPDIPFAKDDANKFLPWIVAFMICLTGLILAAVVSIQAALFRWKGEYSASFTVQIPASSIAESKVDTAYLMSWLADNDWAVVVREIERDEMQGLIEPWLGSGSAFEALPLPLLIEVKLRKGQTVDMAALKRRLEKMAPGAEIDDYRLWMVRFQAFSKNMQWFAGSLAALMIVTTLALVVLAAKTALRLHEKTVDVLHMIGAEDRYIAKQFRKNTSLLVLRGAGMGSMAALILYALAGKAAEGLQSSLMPSLHLTSAHFALFITLPLVTMLAASGFTHRAVISLLAKRQ